MLNIQLLLTGNELMSGDIVDSNSAMIAQSLTKIGLAVKRKVAVSDDINDLIEEINAISIKADVLIVNGGLGPTVDDLTAEALAQVADVQITQHPEALTHITQWCERRNFKLNAPNLKQTMLPDGCDIVPNHLGSAVGFHLRLNNCDIYCTPGVPKELQLMLDKELIPSIESLLPEKSHHHVSRYQVFGIGESSLQKLVDEKIENWPESVELGFRASMPLLELKLTSKSAQAKAEKAECYEQLKALLGDHIVAQIDEVPLTFGDHLQALLREQGKKITFAESCTGGMLASAMTRVAGSSAVFDGSFVSYANHQKQAMLGVNEQTLVQYGAVSEQTVQAMAQGALVKTGADIVVAVSGIAGPDGGSDDKPVGTVWLAWGTSQSIQTVCLHIPANRYYFQHYVTAIGLDLARRLLLVSEETPRYITERQKS
ncbi:CinA family nicotinamide mononucleotide deamidase-related protein [Thalassotalea euphylliae]|uniref:CinA-like protein n=1 Tax=Thalassotalea euphylliae TaxID=1655234 RepID=A0A3E0U5B2_9GAMM|nr:CinA family nicotinamide mononucleotide deamidase-related protein [Thalassotalea euphylliae]REL32148.1 nicotinamide-nucleotide amidohydrolase family protein [Thalassotalea euphylliae]